MNDSVEAGNGFVEKADEQDELHQLAGRHAAAHTPPRTGHKQQDEAEIAEQRHGWRVEGPRGHEARLFVFKAVTGSEKFFLPHVLGGVALDLTNAGKGVVQRGIEGAGRFAGGGGARGHPAGIDPATGGDERRGRENDQGELRVGHEHDNGSDEDLQHSGEALLNAFEDDALRGGHVVGELGEDVAGALMIEPAQRQEFDFTMKLAAQVGDHALLEGAVHTSAEVVESFTHGEGEDCEAACLPDEIRALLRDDFIHEPAYDAGKDEDQARACDGEGEL